MKASLARIYVQNSFCSNCIHTIKEKITAIATAYNDIIGFIDEQKESSWANDSGLQATRRRLQSYLTTSVGVSGDFQSLVSIGIQTNKDDGTVSFDSATLTDAINNDLDSVENLLLGEDGVEGIAEMFTSYIDGITDSTDGLYATRKESTESSIKSIDEQIERIELRLEKREQTMREQFYNLELLMSQMNSTSSYLSQQMTMMSSISSSGGNN
jgi:flagellar hook-associated protein 2